MVNQDKLDDIRTIILSLLLARKGATPVPILERDYYEIEQKRIPYRQFGHSNLVEFLESMPEHFAIDFCNGGHQVRGIASEKSKHVSSLVARQKIHPPRRYIPPHLRQPMSNRRIHMKSNRVRISPDKLFCLMQYVRKNPNGVSLQNAVMFVQKLVPYVNVSPQDLRDQLRELSHQLCLDGNMVYPTQNNNLQGNAVHQQSLTDNASAPQLWNVSESPSNSGSPTITQTVCAAGQEEFECGECLSDELDFVPAGYTGKCQRRPKTSEQLATNLAQYAKCEQTNTVNDEVKSDIEISEDYFAMMNNKSDSEMKAFERLGDISEIICDRTKFRLEELLRKYPEGIWCAHLPDVYLEEYKVHLNYTGLGFSSVREFTSYLPKIFYMTQVNKTDDFILYSADKRPVVPKTKPIDIAQSSHNQHDEHRTVQAQCSNDYDDAPIPAEVSPTITKRFAPNDVMNYDDNVDKISVIELKRSKKFLEVYVVEVFHPNFFWIQLRENKKCLQRLMDELTDFYEVNKNTYTIAKIALKKDLHCACIYINKWHRGIIKSVKPDFRVTVLFYDYGTLKTYAPEDIYYLHKKFSFLPAQAIPCSLYDVKPSVGDRWKKSVSDRFVEKIADTLLAATIVTVDPTYNSMMVILTDTSEEEDVCINDWLVKERLAQVGKMVRMNDIINFFDMRFDIESFMSIETISAESIAKINEPRYYRNQSISRNEKTYKLSDVKSEDIEKKTVKSLHNVPASKKVLLQMLWNKSSNAKSLHAKSSPTKSLDKFPDTKSLDAKSSATKSQLRNYPQNGKSKTSRELVPLEKLKTSSFNRKSNFNPNTSISETNTDNEDNARQINSSRKIEARSNSEDNSFMNFSLRDSDPDENDHNDFGTFRSLYGGRGLMEPIDWSLIREENNLSHKTIATLPNNLDMSIRECKSDVENKSGSHNQKNKIPGKQYFLNMTSLEKENFLPENNIDCNVEDMSDIMEMLKDNISNRIVGVLFTPNEKLKTMYDSVQSEDTSNSNTNNVELNDIASSRKMNQKVDRNGKVYKTQAEQKIENRDYNTDSESAFSNVFNNKDNINGEMSKCNTNNSLESNTNNKVYNPRYKTLLDQIKRKQMDSMNSSSVNTSSSSSEQIQSSSYSFNSSDDTISSSNDEQSKASNRMDMNTCKIDDSVKEFASTSEELSKKLMLADAHSEFEGIRNSSFLETDSITSSNVDNTKQHQLNQSLETDFIASSNIDDTKHQLNQFDSIASCNVDDSNDQLTAADQTLNVPNLMKQMLKIAQNIQSNSELDSDDLSSNQESLKDDKSDESKGDDESDCMSEMCESMNDCGNVTETVAPPVYNDCDVESDESEWDAYAGSKEDFPFYIAQLPSNAND